MNPFSIMLPPKSGDADGLNQWQWLVWAKMWLLLGFAVWSLDLVPGLPGLARASELKSLAADLKASHVSSLEWNLFDLRVKQCAPDTPPPLKQAYGEKIGGLLRKYHAATGQNYHLPPCEDLR